MTKPWTDEDRLMKPPAEDRASFGAAFERLVGVMARLRGPDGCPWDRAQSLESLRPYLLEEAYEVLEALEEGDATLHREELGDLLLQVVFQAELRREAGTFNAADVAHHISDKLVRRHPHVFAEAQAEGVGEAFTHWEAQKAKEKKRASILDGVPKALPGLLRAQRLGEKAARVGFDWPDVSGPLGKLTEEHQELAEAIESGDRARIEHELGDVLFSCANIARALDMSAEDAVQRANDRFYRRFRKVEAAGGDLSEKSLEALEALWQKAKA